MANVNINGQSFTVNFKSGDWLDKFNGNSPLTDTVQLEGVRGSNAHPWATPISSLYGNWANNPDFGDFFADTSKKKTVKQLAVTWEEMMKILEEAWDENKGEFNLKHSAFTQDGWVAQGAAFVTEELTSTTRLLKTHYGIVSVASGFAWSAIGINMSPFAKACKWDIPMLAEATQVALWPVYEELGLGGINELAVEFHGLIQLYAKRGKFYKNTYETLSDELKELYYDTIAGGERNFLQAVWVKLLRSIDLKEDLVCSDEVWDNILMFAHIRALAQTVAKGKPLSDWQKSATYAKGVMTPERLMFVACATAIMRDGAKGRLGLTADDKAINGCLKAIKDNSMYDIVQKNTYKAMVAPDRIKLSTAFFTLVETVDLLTVWQTERFRLLNAEE